MREKFDMGRVKEVETETHRERQEREREIKTWTG